MNTQECIYLQNSNFLNAQSVYIHTFNKLPNVSNLYNIDGEKAADWVATTCAAQIKQIYRSTDYKTKKKKYTHSESIFVFGHNVLIHFDDNFCDIFHDGNNDEFIAAITPKIAAFKRRQRREPHEINLIAIAARGGLALKSMEIKRTQLDLDLYYEDDFKEVDKMIQTRLKKDKDKGIVLLHGLPGTGKTTYLRYLIGKIKKKILFVSPEMANNIMDPGFMDLLIDNPNSVVIIEDAESVIMDRRISGKSAVSNLLNLSDGLLADCLNVQLVCSFNSDLSAVDSALLRKGRLIAKYEFGKLSLQKAQRLSQHLGFNREIAEPMTIAEIANPHQVAVEKTPQVIGFRRATA
ncbi:AAA family ATPase [Chitinophaga vietnamensis]|uniref:AAA family ATPase n=1 Tax=Chitinophaga vietnamensis TaxID=2593957 RepID=UPI0011785368|nr:AAA family ATPase [Chitinophaga vietnamensis]